MAACGDGERGEQVAGAGFQRARGVGRQAEACGGHEQRGEEAAQVVADSGGVHWLIPVWGVVVWALLYVVLLSSRLPGLARCDCRGWRVVLAGVGVGVLSRAMSALRSASFWCGLIRLTTATI